MEVILIVIGILVAAGSFLLPEQLGKKEPEEETQPTEIPTEYIMTEENTTYVKQEVQRIQGESAEIVAEQTEDRLNKIANEKIMSISELSEQILEKINQNHKEVIFLYDLLNDKEQEIKKHLIEIDQSKKEADSILEIYGKDLEIMKETKKLNEIGKRTILQMNGIIKKERLCQEVLKQQTPSDVLPVMAAEAELENLSEPVKEVLAADLKPFNESNQNRNEEILDLYKEKYSVHDIAKKLSMGQGEVKLVLDLFQGGKA